MEKDEIDIKVVVADAQAFLTADEAEVDAQFQQELRG